MIVKEIPGLPGYHASNNGKIYSTKGRILKELSQYDHKGYRKVGVQIEGKTRGRFVHVLMWVAHKGPIPAGLQVNHKDGNKAHNDLENFELTTQSGNIQHSIKAGLRTGKGQGKRLPDEVVLALLRDHKLPRRLLCAKYGLKIRQCENILNGHSRRSLFVNLSYAPAAS